MKGKNASFYNTLAAAATLASCSSDDEAGQSTSRSPKKAGEIAFVTNVGTRGGLTLTDIPTSGFNVCTYNAGSSKFLGNTTFTWDSSDQSYRNTNKPLWPDSGNLDFYAIVPAGGTVATDGKSCSFSSWAGEGDPVAAVAMNQSRQDKVPLTFKHIMTQVSTSITDNTNTGYSAKVQSITMKPKTGGTYTFGTSTGAVGSWSNLSSSKASKLFDYSGSSSCPVYWNIIPQSGVTFTVSYYIYKGSDPGDLLSEDVTVDLSSDIGKMVNINFDFVGQAPRPIPVEIKFSKTISSFDTASGVNKTVQ